MFMAVCHLSAMSTSYHPWKSSVNVSCWKISTITSQNSDASTPYMPVFGEAQQQSCPSTWLGVGLTVCVVASCIEELA